MVPFVQFNILINKDFSAVITDFGSARAIVSGGNNTEETHTLDSSTEKHSIKLPNSLSARIGIEVSSKCLTLSGQNGTMRWSAPELLEDERFDLGTDIWAFGWICWEVCPSRVYSRRSSTDAKFSWRLSPETSRSMTMMNLKPNTSRSLSESLREIFPRQGMTRN